MKLTTEPTTSASPLTVLPDHLGRNGEVIGEQPEPAALRQECVRAFTELLDDMCTRAEAEQPESLRKVEGDLRRRLFELGCKLVTLFLTVLDHHLRKRLGSSIAFGGRQLQQRKAQPRNLMTLFGVVRYWRTYYWAPAKLDKPMRGVYPTDAAVGLGSERVSLGILSLAVYLATRMSFASAKEAMSRTVGIAPSTEVIERGVLGLGAQSQAFFEQLGGFDDDGEVLVIQLDSKGIPTATERELKQRRRKRKPNPHPKSARHRGRTRRKARKKRAGDSRAHKNGHEKNAKMGTLMVAYTLRTADDGSLEGPINKRTWASMSPKKHMVDMAVLEAKRRGFDPTSPSARIQVITDGDNDLERYILAAFPHAIRSIDIMHVLEYVWSAGKALYPNPKNGDALRNWVRRQKKRLLRGRADLVLDELERNAEHCHGRRKKVILKTFNYIWARVDWLDYAYLIEHDLELATGAVEGAVKHVMKLRFDHGGMRWIVDRAEALLTLRCIAVNGDWDAFIDYVERSRGRAYDLAEVIPLLRNKPAPLPHLAA